MLGHTCCCCFPSWFIRQGGGCSSSVTLGFDRAPYAMAGSIPVPEMTNLPTLLQPASICSKGIQPIFMGFCSKNLPFSSSWIFFFSVHTHHWAIYQAVAHEVILPTTLHDRRGKRWSPHLALYIICLSNWKPQAMGHGCHTLLITNGCQHFHLQPGLIISLP